MTKPVVALNDKAWARWTALALLALAMFCSYIFMDILSPIFDLVQSTRGWDATAFGTMQGSETFLNVFIFFLIFAGIILDKMGVRFTAVLSGAVMLVGATINWYALTDMFIGSSLDVWFTEHLNYIPGFDELGISPFYEGMPASAKFSAVGFMIFGCGVEMAGITVSRGIVKWFKGREMALAMGSEMALARLGVATCMIFSPMFANLGGVVDVSRSVAFGVLLLLIACHLTFAFVLPLFKGNSVGGICVAYATILVLGASFSLVPASLWPSVPKLVDSKIIGSAYALIFWIQNIGLWLFPMLIGKVLDATNPEIVRAVADGTMTEEVAAVSKNYTYALVMLAALGVAALVIGLILKVINRRRHLGLEDPNVVTPEVEESEVVAAEE